MGKKGPQTAEGMARAIANLRPAKKGEVRNPAGRPAAGASIREYLNKMQDWTEEDVNHVLTAPGTPMAQKAAARVWLASVNATGNAGAEFDRIMDRTDGKPKQAVELTGKDGGAIQTENTQAFDYEAFRRALADTRRVEPAHRFSTANGN